MRRVVLVVVMAFSNELCGRRRVPRRVCSSAFGSLRVEVSNGRSDFVEVLPELGARQSWAYDVMMT